MEINCMWLNFLKRNLEPMILSMPDLTQKKREKHRFSLFFLFLTELVFRYNRVTNF